jgi:CheY-like chemotaxis protein
MANLMVVDDDPDVLNAIANILAAAGHTVEPVGSPTEALALLDGEVPPDLIVVDVIMPDMNGFELAERARRTRPSIKVLYLSGYWDTPGVADDPAERFGKLLRKPIMPSQLRLAVLEALASSDA